MSEPFLQFAVKCERGWLTWDDSGHRVKIVNREVPQSSAAHAEDLAVAAVRDFDRLAQPEVGDTVHIVKREVRTLEGVWQAFGPTTRNRESL